MVQITDKNLKIAKKFKKKIGREISIDEFVLFGSRASKGGGEGGDFDFLVVSRDFTNVPWHRRAARIYLQWEEDFPLDVLCYTPSEMRKRAGRICVVAEALKHGIAI